MNRIFVLLFVAVITFIVIFFIANPSFFNEIWLYLIGLAGVIIQLFKKIGEKIMSLLNPTLARVGLGKPENRNFTVPTKVEKDLSNGASQTTKPVDTIDTFDGVTLRILRYSTKGSATYGLLYFENNFYSTVVEDLAREDFVSDKVKIPAGIYEIRFRELLDEQTKEYINAFPGLFTFHLELQNVPGFKGILLKPAKSLNNDLGAISITNKTAESTLEGFPFSGKDSFRELYKSISASLKIKRKVRIDIKDEQWFSKVKSD